MILSRVTDVREYKLGPRRYYVVPGPEETTLIDACTGKSVAVKVAQWEEEDEVFQEACVNLVRVEARLDGWADGFCSGLHYLLRRVCEDRLPEVTFEGALSPHSAACTSRQAAYLMEDNTVLSCEAEAKLSDIVQEIAAAKRNLDAGRVSKPEFSWHDVVGTLKEASSNA